MKAKNCRVRINDVKQGVTAYAACPYTGVTKIEFLGRPFMNRGIGLFVRCRKTHSDGYQFEDTVSICDRGINTGNSYNDKKSFFKRKHAENWVEYLKTDKGCVARQKQHESRMQILWDYS